MDPKRRRQLIAEAFELIDRAHKLLTEASEVEARQSAKSPRLSDKQKRALLEGTKNER